MIMILFAMGALAYINFVIGLEDFDAYLTNEAPKWISTGIDLLFGSIPMFVWLVKPSLYFGLIAHYMEALYVMFQCKRKLKMKLGAMASWFFLTLLVGYPSTKKVLKLLALQEKSSAIANEHKAAKKSS